MNVFKSKRDSRSFSSIPLYIKQSARVLTASVTVMDDELASLLALSLLTPQLNFDLAVVCIYPLPKWKTYHFTSFKL